MGLNNSGNPSARRARRYARTSYRWYAFNLQLNADQYTFILIRNTACAATIGSCNQKAQQIGRETIHLIESFEVMRGTTPGADNNIPSIDI